MRRLISVLFALAVGLLVSCSREQPPVLLYTSVDGPVAQKVIDAFTAQTGIPVRVLTDTEASKSVGLAERLRAESSNPRADVWWGNEPFHTAALAEEGHFGTFTEEEVTGIHPTFVDARRRFAGSGLRARVFVTNEQTGSIAGHLEDLLDPRFKGKVALARPTAGTTGGHVATIYTILGEAGADEFFRALHANGVVLLGGNSAVAQQVASGNLLIGLTDNDDVVAATRAGVGEAWQTLIDQDHPTRAGTLAIPTTVAMVVRENEHPDARRLALFLLSPDAERILSEEGFIVGSARGAPPFKALAVDYAQVSRRLPEWTLRATRILEGQSPTP